MTALTRRSLLIGATSALAAKPLLSIAAPSDSLRASMFRRALICEVPFLPPAVQDNITERVYPQGLALDATERELFIFYSYLKKNPEFGTLCCVYDTESLRLKSWFRTPELCRESFVFRRVGQSRRVYTVGLDSPLFYDVTRLPPAGASLDPEQIFRPEQRSYAQLAWTGKEFVYMSGERDEQRRKGKQRFIRADAVFRQTGTVDFPLGVVGSYDKAQVLHYPKAQGVAYTKGMFLFSCGKNYARSGRGREEDPLLPSTQQGLIACDPDGRRLADALVSPDFALAQFGKMAGRSLQMIENESITASGGGAVALWQTCHPSQWATDGRKSGLLVTEEMSGARAAVDFSEGAVSLNEVMRRDLNRSLPD
ncbi:hypothetical protein [Methylorubrum extorquens]|uniref:Uncharacterized protein n=1 Tax=Methylorubrum extorquens TaxID=408 RepID=A0AAX3WBE2_METEX|nr:hypothetical protein [Methylorubrum extorquens]WHQ68767.1 hypothetical protein KEC54_20755 [Methylorubrum extorquens]